MMPRSIHFPTMDDIPEYMKTPPQTTNGHPAVLPEKPHISLHTEPTADILILGEMMVASNAQADFLKKLAKSGSEYRGYLYQIKAAAIRVSGLANKLLGEAK